MKAVPDPRRQCDNLKHRLEDVLVLASCGTLAGCDDFAEIAVWARLHEDFFRSFLGLDNGTPSQDTFNRVFSAVKADPLRAVLVPRLRHRRGDTGEFVPVDGKAMRGTGSAASGVNALHVDTAGRASRD